MIFNSLTYLTFLFFVVTAYWILPRRQRLILIFLSSLTFYGFWKFSFIPVMMASVIIDYFVALKIDKTTLKKNKKKLLYISVIANLSLLFYFKYLIFFSNNAIGLVNLFGFEVDPILLKIILPLGISFYTFQTISYTVDVYRGFIKPEKDFILYSSYVTFFPQLVAGPVLRASEVIFQLDKRPAFNISFIPDGIKRIIYGLFLKVVLADNIGAMVDSGFLLPSDLLSAIDVLTLSFLFGFQIYFDFSAYSHIAIGSAKLMGISFPENFNFPYNAESPKDFWKRWHISLSSWIRDYLYLPLTGSKVINKSIGGIEVAISPSGKTRDRALFTSWAIMGLWHGANWTFVVWGLYHAIFIYLHRLLSSKTYLQYKAISIIGSFATLPIMMLGWIPFRAESVQVAINMWNKVLQPSEYFYLGLRENNYLVAAIIMLGIYAANLFHVNKNILKKSLTKKILTVIEIIFFTILIVLIFIFIRPLTQFIYFQF